MSDTCLFCRIVQREIPAAVVYESDDVLAFRDIDPKAPTHIVLVPKSHVSSLNDAKDPRVLGELLRGAAVTAEAVGIAESGYRTVINCGGDGGQTVSHLHLHLLGGRALGWPPG